MTFTQAEREKMAALFARATQIRLHIPPKPDYGEMFYDHLIFVPSELAQVVAMIRGEAALLREALEPLARIGLWRDLYPDATEDFPTDRRLKGLINPDDVRRARALLGTLPAAQ